MSTFKTVTISEEQKTFYFEQGDSLSSEESKVITGKLARNNKAYPFKTEERSAEFNRDMLRVPYEILRHRGDLEFCTCTGDRCTHYMYGQRTFNVIGGSSVGNYIANEDIQLKAHLCFELTKESFLIPRVRNVLHVDGTPVTPNCKIVNGVSGSSPKKTAIKKNIAPVKVVSIESVSVTSIASDVKPVESTCSSSMVSLGDINTKLLMTVMMELNKDDKLDLLKKEILAKREELAKLEERLKLLENGVRDSCKDSPSTLSLILKDFEM